MTGGSSSKKSSSGGRKDISRDFSPEESAVGYLLRFGKRTVELILRDWTVTWLKSEETNGWAGNRV
jgi:hypothetical protein